MIDPRANPGLPGLLPGLLMFLLSIPFASSSFAAAPQGTHSDGSDPDAGMVGVVFARQEIDLATEVEGRVEAVEAELGQAVAEGEIVARLDAWSVERDLERAQAELESARVEERKASLTHDQAEEKLTRHASVAELESEEQLDDLRLDVEIAAADLEVARSRIAQLKSVVGKLTDQVAASRIRAPFAGTVAGRYQDPGTVVYPGTPIIRLISSDDLWIRFAAPENLAPDLKPGQLVEVTIESAACRLTGAITHISPEIDSASQMLFVEAPLTVPADLKHRVRSGMTARVRLASPSEP